MGIGYRKYVLMKSSDYFGTGKAPQNHVQTNCDAFFALLPEDLPA